MADLALLLGAGDVITLSGDLGAGKTAAARALIRYLAQDDELEVPSPTFTLAQTYDLPPFPLLHADLYRIADPDELEEIGLSPLPEGTVALIEWPERAPRCLRTGSTSHSAIAHRSARRARCRDHRLRQACRQDRTANRACASFSNLQAASMRSASACPAMPRRARTRG
jgi:tRNA threonylcarbamoyl adenosine modification protein YjeE